MRDLWRRPALAIRSARRSTAIVSLSLLGLLGACDRQDDPPPVEIKDPSSHSARPGSTGSIPSGWGAMLLSLIPERGDGSTPSIATVRGLFANCGIGSNGALRGRCNLMGGKPTAADAPSVGVEINGTNGEARSIRMGACCSTDDDFFRPFASQRLISTELMCSELTIVSSETVQAFRGSATGKRDFVYARGTQTTAQGRRVDLTVLLYPLEKSDECAALAAAHAKFDEAGQ